jgi:Fe-S oxidoreductase/electron transfer flavoprotein alpha/beta subunit
LQTREIFWSIGPSGVALFYVLGLLSIATFLWGFARHLVKYSRGRPLDRGRRLPAGIRRMLWDVTSHRTLKRRDRLAGLAHQGVFYGFLIAAAGTTIIFIDYDISRGLFSVQLWKGYYYLTTSLALDVGHLTLIVGVTYFIARRLALGLPKLDYIRRYRGEAKLRPSGQAWRIEDWLFLGSLLIIEITGFLQEGARLMVDRPGWDDWSPVGGAVGRILRACGMSVAAADHLRVGNWWFHGVLALVFTAAIPWYKAKHMLAVTGSLALRDTRPLSRLPKEPENADRFGIASVADFTWKEMLQLDACTKCGRCHDACPARASKQPLSPRDLILDLRLLNDREQGQHVAGGAVISDVIAPETLWACMSCGACQEICPVGIEHPPLIVKMRRHLIEQNIMDPQLRTTLGIIGDTGNSFGEAPRKRPAWTDELDFKIKDIRDEPAEVLWFVGDYASFDPRNQKVSRTVARLLKSAGVDFALLQESEWTAGNDIRRVGEEGLFESLVHHNLRAMSAAKPFKRIITTDPHSYNTIRNEYPEFGKVAPIEHYTSVLAELLAAGHLKVQQRLERRVTFHDPCHLGRLNGGYDAPRQVLAAIGCELVEMPRNRDNSYCCGAGGGRIWIADGPDIERPSISRMHEAAGLGGIDVFVTCCPKDLTMYEDARKTSGHEQSFVVHDLAELVAEAIEKKAISVDQLPALSERIVEAVAKRIGDVISARLSDLLAQQLTLHSKQVVADAPVSPEPETPQVHDPIAGTGTAVQASQGEVVKAPETPFEISAPALIPMDWDRLAPVRPAALPIYDIPPKQGPRILVTIKHVATLVGQPGLTPESRDVGPEYLEFAMNEWDDAALEEALRAVEKIGSGEVVVVTIGDERADVSLRKALAKGAHRAVRVWSPSLAIADPITVARGLAGVAEKEAPDLIFCGVQSSDQANGSTGIALARILDLPHAAVVVGVEWDGAGTLTLTRELEGGVRHRFQLPSPAVVAVQSGINTPRYATMRMIKEAKRKVLVEVDGAGIADGAGGYIVRKIYTPQLAKAEMLEGSPDEVAAFVAGLIRKKVRT